MCLARSTFPSSVPSSPPSGFRQFAFPIILGFLFNTFLYWACSTHLSKVWPLSAANEYCPRNKECTRNDLLAFQFVSGIMLLFLGLVGFYSWSMSNRPNRKLAQTPEGRYFGMTLPEADYINAAIVVFQGWDFVASLLIEEHRTGIMLMHHAMAFAAGAGCLHYRVNPYYAVYFGGASEFSSIFLVIVDLFKFFPPPQNSSLSKFEFACQLGFVIAFFLYRVVGWVRVVCLGLLPDLKYLVTKKVIHQLRPGSTWFAYYLGFIGVVLTGLQLFWFSQICSVAMETLE